MKLFKDSNNQLFVDPIVENHSGLVELTKAQFDKQLAINSAPSQEELLNAVSSHRKFKEDDGVIYNGIRYSGEQSNRQAISEAIQAATEFSLTSFVSWKDSDGGFHQDVPVADVNTAYSQIGQKRMALIALEGVYSEQVRSGLISTFDQIEGLDWTV